MRKHYCTVVTIVICLSGSAQTANADRLSALENLIANQESLKNAIRPEDDAVPIFEFGEMIDRTTDLKKLADLRRKLGKKYGITLVYLQIENDSTGLTSITVDASSAARRYGSVKYPVPIGEDFGMFVLLYQRQRYFFIGAKSSWPLQLHDLLANR